jgi:hypothetical protein
MSDGGEGERLCLTAECVQTAASLLAAMDHTVDPCHDFFQVHTIIRAQNLVLFTLDLAAFFFEKEKGNTFTN